MIRVIQWSLVPWVGCLRRMGCLISHLVRSLTTVLASMSTRVLSVKGKPGRTQETSGFWSPAASPPTVSTPIRTSLPVASGFFKKMKTGAETVTKMVTSKYLAATKWHWWAHRSKCLSLSAPCKPRMVWHCKTTGFTRHTCKWGVATTSMNRLFAPCVIQRVTKGSSLSGMQTSTQPATH